MKKKALIIGLILLIIGIATAVWHFKFRRSIKAKNVDYDKGTFDYSINWKGYRASGSVDLKKFTPDNGKNENFSHEISVEGDNVLVTVTDLKAKEIAGELVIDRKAKTVKLNK